MRSKACPICRGHSDVANDAWVMEDIDTNEASMKHLVQEATRFPHEFLKGRPSFEQMVAEGTWQ